MVSDVLVSRSTYIKLERRELMTRRNILDLFVHFFPHFGEKIDLWFPHGKNCIRVRLKSGCELMFAYNGPKDWMVETADSYIKKMKGVQRM